MYICRMKEGEYIEDIYELSNGELAARLGERFKE